jgi:hypothetical protein
MQPNTNTENSGSTNETSVQETVSESGTNQAPVTENAAPETGTAAADAPTQMVTAGGETTGPDLPGAGSDPNGIVPPPDAAQGQGVATGVVARNGLGYQIKPDPDPERVAKLIASMNDNKNVRFKPLDRVQWIDGLKNSDFLDYGEAAVVVRHLDDDNLNRNGEPRDLELGFIALRDLPGSENEEGDEARTEEFFLTATFDSRRFRHV